jgi:hypothetical protein
MMGSALGAALPTVSDAADDGVEAAIIDPMAMANAPSKRPRHKMLTIAIPHLSPGTGSRAARGAAFVGVLPDLYVQQA